MVAMTVRLPDEVQAKLRLYAERHGLSLNQAAVELIDKGVDQAPAPAALSFGTLDFGDPGLAEHHEERLTGFGER